MRISDWSSDVCSSDLAVEVWQWTPFVILIMLAGLQTLPDDVYEAAALENATPWQQFKGITFPMLLPISAAVVFIRLIESFKIMDTEIGRASCRERGCSVV